ncbi:MAG: hypothetical protein ACE5JN_16795 [Candidatus Methylomirabilia bacterium]
MAFKKDPITVSCPCCHAKLRVDPALRAVIAHDPPPRSGPARDLNSALQALEGASARRTEAFKETLESEQGKGKLLDRKFRESLKKAKDEPDPPLRPIDVD